MSSSLPTLLTGAYFNVGAIFHISNDRTGTAMVGWEGSYSETQRRQPVKFVRSLVAE